jgi:hypothetical protein
MAHFAEIDSNNVVLRVLVVADEHEHRGQEFLANDCGLGGTWIQTSYNSNIRGKFAGMGDIYDEVNDEFYTPVSDVVDVESTVNEQPAIEGA